MQSIMSVFENHGPEPIPTGITDADESGRHSQRVTVKMPDYVVKLLENDAFYRKEYRKDGVIDLHEAVIKDERTGIPRYLLTAQLCFGSCDGNAYVDVVLFKNVRGTMKAGWVEVVCEAVYSSGCTLEFRTERGTLTVDIE